MIFARKSKKAAHALLSSLLHFFFFLVFCTQIVSSYCIGNVAFRGDRYRDCVVRKTVTITTYFSPSTKLYLSTYSDDGSPSDYDIDDLVSTRKSGKTVSTSGKVGTSSSSAFGSDSNDNKGIVNNSNDEEDASIREALKRELLLLSSITNRGEYATIDEQNVLVDIVAQLEALNPTPQPALALVLQTTDENYIDSTSSNTVVWDLCLSSTQFFRSSPFFQTIRAAVSEFGTSVGSEAGLGTDGTSGSSSTTTTTNNNNNPNLKLMIDNAFDIHDRATTASRVGRVRQTITTSASGSGKQLISEVDLEVGIVPGLPFRVKGTVVTTADIVMETMTDDTFELVIVSTRIKNSNVPIINQLSFLGGDGLFNGNKRVTNGQEEQQEQQQVNQPFGFALPSLNSFLDTFVSENGGERNRGEIPIGQIYKSLLGSVPKIPNKTYYLDESMRITRDQDENFFIFTRA